jgi:hypothetical protein
MQNEELARRAVACKHWRWMPGMLSRRLSMFTGVDICRRFGETEWPANPYNNEYPDLTDPATLGCLLHLVREAWGEQMEVFAYRTEMHDKRWCIERAGSERDPSRAWYGWTEAEALVAALEAAP